MTPRGIIATREAHRAVQMPDLGRVRCADVASSREAAAAPQAVWLARWREDLLARIVNGSRRPCWPVVAYAWALLCAGVLGYFLVRTPFQVSDNVGNILALDAMSLRDLLWSQFSAVGYLRPFLWAQLKVVYDLTGGESVSAYRAVQLGQVVIAALLCVRLMRVRDAADALLVPLALMVLFGLHTFNLTVREAHPVNAFLTIVVSCLAAANLADSRGGWAVDVTAVALLILAIFTLETGLLVWVCLVAGYLVGFRGVSRVGLVLATLLVCAYLFLRFGPLEVGVPSLAERTAGFGFSNREPAELQQMFEGRVGWFYAYNVVCSALSVLFSEPRGGLWIATRSIVQGGVQPWMLINICVSVLSTMVLVRFAIRRSSRWRRAAFHHDDRLFLLFLAVLGANAFISFPYAKDVVMSPAGALYACAVFVAVRDLVSSLAANPPSLGRGVAIASICVAVGLGWSVRAAGLAHSLRYAAFVNRNDWALVLQDLDRDSPGWRTPHRAALVGAIQRQVVTMPVPNPYFTPRWIDRYVDPY